jgi:MoaA/NifB/PqqE/SkfB family radical SAM enzyme
LTSPNSATDRLASAPGALARRGIARRLHRRERGALGAAWRAWAPDAWPLRRLQLELVNRCNLRCPLCRTLLDDGVRRRRMELGEMKRMLEPVAGSLEAVTLYGTRGEPLLHTDLERCIHWLKTATAARVSVSSNGTLLAERRVKPLLDSGLDELIVAVDGLSQESYRRYRVGGDLEVVLDNLRRFCRARREGGYATRVILQMIPMSTNEHEIERLSAVGAELGVDRARLKISSSVAQDATFRPSQQPLVAAEPGDGPLECPFGLDKLYVDPNGDSYPCCYAEGVPHMLLGNALETSLLGVWRSATLWRLRAGFAQGTGHHPFCLETCSARPPRQKVRLYPPPAAS